MFPRHTNEDGLYTARFEKASYLPVWLRNVQPSAAGAPAVVKKAVIYAPIAGKSEPAAYPNPARGNIVTFVYYVERDSDVVISVYNANGEKSAEISESGKNGGSYNETRWNASGMAQGIYLYVVKLKPLNSGAEITLPVKKLSIIR